VTIDSPKGPEREARPEEVSLPELRYAPNGRVAVRRPGQFDEWVVVAGPDLSWLADVRPNADDVEAWPALPSPAEVERLTAEVERLRSEHRGLAETAGALIRRMNNAEEEVSRLREQLATAALPDDGSIAELIYEHVKPVPDHEHSSDWTLSRLSVNAAEQAILALAAPVSESVPVIPQHDVAESIATRTLQSLVFELREKCDKWDREFGVCGAVPEAACGVRSTLGLHLIAAQNALGADPLRASAPSEASQEVMHDDLADSPIEDRSTWTRVEPNSVNRVGSASTPPAGGDSDTTPRRWTVGDPEPTGDVTVRSGLCDWRRGDNLLWHAYRNGERVGQHAHTWSSLIAIFDLTEVLPCTEQEKE
jgi:hypothetical protein